MKSQILDYLAKEVPIAITPGLASQLSRMVIAFELRDDHPLTLNSQMFGVNKFTFSSKDRQMLFDIIGYNETDVVKTISKIKSINKDFKVVSDPFNLLSTWVAHLILVSGLSVNAKHDTAVSVLNYMQYKIIGSAVNHYFPHGANYDIMQTVIEALSMKFSVRQSGSWKKVVEERSMSLAFDTKAHHNTLIDFNVDTEILYLISDTSTRIRSQLKIITASYYDIRETGNFIASHSSTTTLDGEKIIRERSSSFEMISAAVFNKCLVKSSFVDERYIRMVQVSVPRLNVGIIRRLLVAVSDEARQQMTDNELNKIITKRDGTVVYVGVETMIDKMIHVIYSSAIHSSKVNINSKIAIYTNTRNIAAAARSSNPEMLAVKASLDQLIRKTRISVRDSTISGLSVACFLYITLLSFGTL